MTDETPKAAARRLLNYLIVKGYKPTGLWTYTDQDGNPLFHKARLDPPTADLKKELRPFHMNGVGYVLGEPEFPNGKPLYGLQQLAQRSEDIVWFVEGEKCADALNRLGLVAVTAGSCTSDDKVDLRPLRGCTVVTWPDNNIVGREHASRIAVRLISEEVSLKVNCVDMAVVESLPDGGDCVDWLEQHPNATKADVEALIADVEAPITETTSKLDARTEVQRLSKLPRLKYEQQRSAAAKALGIRASALDAEVKALRGDADDPVMPMVVDVEPATDPVQLADLLEALRERFSKHVVASSHSHVAACLWVAWTWVQEFFDCAPILLVKSPVKRCGKTSLLSIVTRTARRPIPASNITESALFRTIAKYKPTIIMDEADSFLPEKEGLRGLCNAGHTRETAFSIRSVGDTFEPTAFPTFGAKVIGLIGKTYETIEDRSITINLQRKLPDQKVEKMRDVSGAVWIDIRRSFARWSQDHGESLLASRPKVPDQLNDRLADSWDPLLAIADHAGGKWPDLAREAAVALADTGEESGDTQLLAHVWEVLDRRKDWLHVFGADLVKELIADEDWPYLKYGKSPNPISQNQLSRRLGKFGLTSRTVNSDKHKPNERSAKGWPRTAFDDAFVRYLPSGGSQTVSASTTSTGAAVDAETVSNPPEARNTKRWCTECRGDGCPQCHYSGRIEAEDANA